jgi:hypothetical protein
VPAQAGIAWEAGLACFAGKTALYEKMLRKFLELKPRAVEEIREALARPRFIRDLKHDQMVVRVCG